MCPSTSALVQLVPPARLTLVIAAELSHLKAVSFLEACWPSGGKGGRIPERRMSSPRPGGQDGTLAVQCVATPSCPWWRAPPAGPLGASSGFNHRCPRLAHLCGPGPPQHGGGRGSHTPWEASPRSDGTPPPTVTVTWSLSCRNPRRTTGKNSTAGCLWGLPAAFRISGISI